MPVGGKTFQETGKIWSEWQDLNLRPPAPEAGALPGCATLRPPRLTYIDVSPEGRKKRPDCRGARGLAYRCPWLGLLVGGRPLTIILVIILSVRAWPNFRAGSRAHHRQRIGAWPSGKATGFGPVILGSNPSAPANRVQQGAKRLVDSQAAASRTYWLLPTGQAAHNGRATALTNVCFEGKNGHDADVERCLLMTQSGHCCQSATTRPEGAS